ncbi:excisionase [Methylomonas koyamae]|uniref:Excisionase n=1 Tax=Methylomonas koyamae TaxID=702114 RepID=A0A177N849_9GAMM|nr:helix-turn-helix domain-containing protein [Methylomonas koyamae]OAI14216.1 excisionase [Methylomonas koyamae]
MAISTPNQQKDEILGNSDAAEYIGVTPRTLEVWRCTKRYQIPFIKVGRLVKYRKSALDAFLESRTIGAEG